MIITEENPSFSLNLNQLRREFRGDDKPPRHLGFIKDYNIDMNHKIMKQGNIVDGMGRLRRLTLSSIDTKEQNRSKWLSRMLKLFCNIEDKVEQDSGFWNVRVRCLTKCPAA